MLLCEVLGRNILPRDERPSFRKSWESVLRKEVRQQVGGVPVGLHRMEVFVLSWLRYEFRLEAGAEFLQIVSVRMSTALTSLSLP